MKRPTQPDQISGRVEEEEAEMFFRMGVKLVMHFYTFELKVFILVICQFKV